MLLLMLILAMLGTCFVSAGATTVPYRTVQQSQKPVKVGNSYVWQQSDREIKVKKSKNSLIKSVRGKYQGIEGITNGSTIYYISREYGEATDYVRFVLGKYSIATGKHTEYKRLEGHGSICGYYNNKIYYADGGADYGQFYSFDTKTKKTSLISNSFYGSYSYGEYVLGTECSSNRNQLKAYNMKTKKFIILSSKDTGISLRAYGEYYYYAKYIAKASGDMDKYKIYKFNLKTGKSAPVSKTFTALFVDDITNKKVTYYQGEEADIDTWKSYALNY